MRPSFYDYLNSAKDSLNACHYHLTEMKKANEYTLAYAHTKALIFEAKSTLDGVAATLNSLFELGIVESHVFFNQELINKLSARTRDPSVKKKYVQLVQQSVEVLVTRECYFPPLRTYLSTLFAFRETPDGRYLLSDTPGILHFEPGIEVLQYCEKLLESVKYVFNFCNELIEDVSRTETDTV